MTIYDITPIIEAVAALIAALITAFVIPYIKGKTTANQQQQINAWVRIAVTAAEQIYTGSGRGAEKKEYVINWLREHGMTVDESKLDALIEAAVYDLNNGFLTIEASQSPRQTRRSRKEHPGMSNSPLANYTLISPNKNSPRNHKIDTITIHCFVAQVTAKRGCEVFQPTSKKASCNYVVGYDGSIGLCVDEGDRSWCTSSGVNDHRAITIEVASDNKEPYAVTEKAYAAMLDLVTDICKRNGIKKLVWSTNKNERMNHLNGCNMTVHRDYANKSCPGTYLYSRHGEIAAEVNKRLGATDTAKPEPEEQAKTLYRVQTGAFKNLANAKTQRDKVKAAGFDTYLVQSDGYYKVQVGAFAQKANATACAAKLKAAGFPTYITTKSGTPA